jgi:hypothetical protein
VLPIDLTEVLKDAPAGEWLALSQDQQQLLGSGRTLEDAIRMAQEHGEDSPIVMKVPVTGVLIL